MTCAATGQLTAAEFEEAVQLFVEWWQAVASSSSSSSSSVQRLCWSLECTDLPVTGQVVAYAQLERVVSASSTDHQQQHMQLPSSAAAAAAHELHLPQQQQQLLDAALPVHAELETEDDEAAVSHAPAPAARAASAAADAAVNSLPRAQQQQQHLHQYSIVYHDMYRVPVLYLRATEPDGRPLLLCQLLQESPALQQYREASQSGWTFITQVQDHPLQRVPCFMLHPCQTAARMQLLLQEQCNKVAQAAAAVIDSTPVAEEASVAVLVSDNRSDSRCSRMPESAAAAAAAGVMTPGGSLQCGGDEHNTVTGHALLLLYMRAWFSMVAGLLGIDMLPFYDDFACSGQLSSD